jgi:hypothetical protein
MLPLMQKEKLRIAANYQRAQQARNNPEQDSERLARAQPISELPDGSAS